MNNGDCRLIKVGDFTSASKIFLVSGFLMLSWPMVAVSEPGRPLTSWTVSSLLPSSVPSREQLKKTVSASMSSLDNSTKGVRDYVRTVTILDALSATGKLAYNAAKLQMVRILVTHSLPRNYAKMRNPEYQWWSGDTVQAAVFAVSAYALLESIYTSYVSNTQIGEKISRKAHQKMRDVVAWCGLENNTDGR